MLRNSIDEMSAHVAAGGGAPGQGVGKGVGNGAMREAPEDAPEYLFDLLVAARRLAVTRRHRFLAYLIGMAAEEARLLSQGRSAVRSDVTRVAS